jgi:hypothetical protein
MNPTDLIDQHIAEITDWRGAMMAKLRTLIHEVEPEITEEWKWSTPIFSHKGMVCALGAFKDHVKVNFFKGAALPDPKKLFNAGLDAKATRAIDFSEDDKIDEVALKELIRTAVAYDTRK